MSGPKGKLQTGQVQQNFQHQRFPSQTAISTYIIKNNPVDTSRGPDAYASPQIPFTTRSVAAVIAAHGQHSVHSPLAQAPPPTAHGQGSVSTGGMMNSLHHPGSGGPNQSGPPPQSQQQAPTPTSTPPGAPSQQQHGDMSKQGPPPHMQGQQGQLPGNAHGLSHYGPPRHTQYVQRPPTPRITHRGMPGNNISPQPMPFQQVGGHPPAYPSPNIMGSNMSGQTTVYAAPIVPPFSTQSRGNNPAAVPTLHYSAAPYLMHMMYPNQPQSLSSLYFPSMVRANMPVPQQNSPHVGSQASPQSQSQSSSIPGAGSGTQVNCIHEKTQATQARRKFAIPIVHPETGKDLLDELCSEGSSNSAAATPPRSGESSARQTPQPALGPSDNIVAAEFAAKVAMVAAEDSNLPRSQSRSIETTIYPMSVTSRGNGPTQGHGAGGDDNNISRVQSRDIGSGYSPMLPGLRDGSSIGGHANPMLPGNARDIPTAFHKHSVPVNTRDIASVDTYNNSVVPVNSRGHVNGPTQGQVADSESSSHSISLQKEALSHQTKDTIGGANSKPIVSEPWKSKSISSSNLPAQTELSNTQVESSEYNNSPGYKMVTDVQPVTSSPSSDKESLNKKVDKSSTMNQMFDTSSKESELLTAKTSSSPSVQTESPQHSSTPVVVTSSSGKQSAPPTAEGLTVASSNVHAQQQSNATLSASISLPQRPKREDLQQTDQTASSEVINEEVDTSDGKGTSWQAAKNRNIKRDTINRRGAEKEGSDMDALVETYKSKSKDEKQAATSVPATVEVASMDPKLTPISPPQAVTPVISSDVSLSSDSYESSPEKHQLNVESPAATTKDESTKEKSSPDEKIQKIVKARNEENLRACAEPASQASAQVPPTVIDKPLEAIKPLVYSKDQWSPQNVEGKKKYDRDFLIQLREDPQSKKRPEDLLEFPDIVVSDAYKNRSKDSRPLGTINRGGNTEAMLLPTFMNRNSLTKKNSHQGKAKASRVIQLDLSLNEEVKLNETENAWRPQRLAPKTEEDIDSSHEELYKKVRSVLNKLTPQKFDLLVEQVKALPIDTKEKLEGVINLVFKKAVDEPNFAVAYAMMCETLSSIQVPVGKSKDLKDGKPEYAQFKKLLLLRCQQEFEQRDSKESLRREERLKELEGEKKKELEMQLEEEDRRIRMKYVGLNRFIGELYKRQMLTGNIMVQCIQTLLEHNDEESLECLCKLLSTIGKALETHVEKDKKAVDLKSTFSKMQTIVDSRKTSSRIRFMLQDVIELRRDKWKPRRADSNPKTMDEIAKEAERESLNQMTSPMTPLMRSNKDERDRERKRGRAGMTGTSEDGWSVAVGTGGVGRVTSHHGPVEKSKLQIDKGLGQVNLGSTKSFNIWSQGSRPKPEINTSNSFSVLGLEEKRSINLSTLLRSTGRETIRAESKKLSAAGDAPEVTRPSQPSSRDSSVLRDETPAISTPSPLSTTVRRDCPVSQAKLEDSAKVLLDEYLNLENAQMLVECVKDEVHYSQIEALTHHWFDQCFECPTYKRAKTAHALVVLSEAKILLPEHVKSVLTKILNGAYEMTVDIPMIYFYLAELIVPLMMCKLLSFCDIAEALKIDTSNVHSKFLVECKKAPSKFLVECMKLLQKEEGPGWILQSWKGAEMNWSDYVPECEVEKFLTDNGLCYFLEDSEKRATCISQVPRNVMSYTEMHERLVKFMNKSDVSYDNLVQWITVNVGKEIQNPKYIRALMTAICEAGVEQKKLNLLRFNELSKLIRRYADNKEELELQALYAIQAFVHRLEHPATLLASILHPLAEEGILSRDSVQAWVDSADPAEHEGRGVALKSINQFLAWFHESDDD